MATKRISATAVAEPDQPADQAPPATVDQLPVFVPIYQRYRQALAILAAEQENLVGDEDLLRASERTRDRTKERLERAQHVVEQLRGEFEKTIEPRLR